MVVARPDTVSAAREVARLPTAEARAPLIEGLVNDGLSLKNTHVIVDAALDDPDQAATIVAEHVASRRRTPVQKRPAAKGSGLHVEREMERDWSEMVALVGRWQARLPTLTLAQRAGLQDQLNVLLGALEELAERMR